MNPDIPNAAVVMGCASRTSFSAGWFFQRAILACAGERRTALIAIGAIFYITYVIQLLCFETAASSRTVIV
jgi:hypothetical protein